MPNSDGDQDRASHTPAIGSQEAQKVIASKSDIGHRIFADAVLDGLVARQSIFPGAIFRNCQLIRCDFSRSDFEGVRFERCRLDTCSFEDCDLRSTLFANCAIQNCSLDGVYFSDNTVRGGCLKQDSFDGATIIGNQFISVRIDGMSNERATLLHNDFISSRMNDITLGDCTALYSYFQDCRFYNFRINADSLGLSFGLTAADVKNAGLIFLGRDEEKPINTAVIDELIREFARRRWELHAVVASLNFSYVDALSGWSALLDLLKKQVVQGGIRLDDVTFVMHLAERLAERNKLPFFPIIRAHDGLADVIL